MRIHTKTFGRLSPMDQRDNLAAWERDATEAAERGLEPADRARGRRMLKRIDKLREEFIPASSQEENEKSEAPKAMFVVVEKVIGEEEDEYFTADALHSSHGYFTDENKGWEVVERLNEQALKNYMERTGDSCPLDTDRIWYSRSFRLCRVDAASAR